MPKQDIVNLPEVPNPEEAVLGFSKGRRTKDQMAFDRRRIAAFHLRGWSQQKIAKIIGVSQKHICLDLEYIRQSWREHAMADIGTKAAEELAKLDWLEMEYRKSWEMSQRDQGDYPSLEEEADDVPVPPKRPGDPRYLAGVQWCLTERAERYGFKAAIKLDINQEITSKETLLVKELSSDELRTLLRLSQDATVISQNGQGSEEGAGPPLLTSIHDPGLACPGAETFPGQLAPGSDVPAP